MATLNLQNPSGLYSGGTVSFDATPYVKMALEARARKQAREDAIDKYYQNLPNTINDKGVRDQEVPLINEYKNKIFEYGLKNKEALRNPRLDNGASQFNLQKLIRDAQSIARESQDLGKRSLERGKMYLSKDGRWAVDDEEFMTAEELESLPINDPRHKKMDVTGLLSNRPFDEPTFAKDVRGRFKYSYGTPTIIPHPTDALSQIETPTITIGDEEKRKMYSFAAEKFHREPKFRKEIETNLSKSGTLPMLNDISVNTFGHKIENDEDIAAAYTVSKLLTPEIKPKTVANRTAVEDRKLEDWNFKNDKLFRQQKIMEALRQGNRERFFTLRKKYEDLSEEEKMNDVDAFIQGEIEEANSSKQEVGTLGKPIKASPVILEAFALKDPVTNKHVTPSGITLLYNGNFKIVYPSENIDDKEITRKEYKAGLVNKVFNTKTKIDQINQQKKGEFDDLK